MPNFNYRDPRFQRAMLSAGANPTVNPVGASQAITSNFVNQQQGVLGQFEQLAENKRRFKAGMGLARKRQNYQEKSFNRQLSNSKMANKLGLVGGIGTSLVAGLIGLDNRKKLQLEAKEMKDFKKKQLAGINAHNSKMDAILSKLGEK